MRRRINNIGWAGIFVPNRLPAFAYIFFLFMQPMKTSLDMERNVPSKSPLLLKHFLWFLSRWMPSSQILKGHLGGCQYPLGAAYWVSKSFRRISTVLGHTFGHFPYLTPRQRVFTNNKMYNWRYNRNRLKSAEVLLIMHYLSTPILAKLHHWLQSFKAGTNTLS
jgi:hypothetical protein